MGQTLRIQFSAQEAALLGRPAAELNTEIDLTRIPCGCPACDDGVQPGHFACEQPPAAMLQAEIDGQVTRSYDDGAWRWFVV